MRIQVIAIAGGLFLASLAAVWGLGGTGSEGEPEAPERSAVSSAARPGPSTTGSAATGSRSPSRAHPGPAAAEGGPASGTAAAPAASALPAADDVAEAERRLASREAEDLLDEGTYEDEVRAAADEAYARLHSADPDQRLDAIQDLAFHDPERARAEIERMLANEGDPEVRLAAYEELLSLIEDEAERIDLMVRGLADRSDAVREHIAYQVSTEDTDTYPQLVSAMHRALAAERNPDVYDQIESSLELMDPSFVPRHVRELEEPLEDVDFVGIGTDPGNG
jgi:hypothetical protein